MNPPPLPSDKLRQSSWHDNVTSAWKSGLSSKFDKTGTKTGPHRLKNLEKLDQTDDTRCTGMNVKVRKTRNKDQVPREKP